MASVRKMSQGDKTPTLYTFYNKLYDFDDLQREADLGLDDYLGTLRRGSKDEIEFRKAYQDIMLGIKDGTITFNNGRYVDSTGRRSNSPGKNKSKDHYGLMASYIYSKQGRSKEYTKPSTNPKWEGSSSAGKWLVNELFGSGTPNLEYFIELDPYNEETKTRGLDRRSSLIINAMKKLHKGLYTDNNILFEGLSDQDKTSYKAILESAINNAKTNGIGKDDYLSFTKAFGDLGYSKWFSTDPIQARQVLTGQDQGGLKTQRELFAEWARNTYPLPSRTLNTFQITSGLENNGRYLPYTSQDNDQITRIIHGFNDNVLNKIFGNILYTQGYNFNELLKKYTQADYKLSNSSALEYILNEMRQRNMWKLNGEDYFYKIPTIKGLSLKWNGNSLQEVSDWDNPFLTEIMINEYNSSLGGDYSPYFAIYDRLASYKQGGIIKAKKGTTFEPDVLPSAAPVDPRSHWYMSLQDYDPAKYTYSYDTSRLVNADMSDNNWDAWVSNIAGLGTGRYKPTNGNTKEYTLGIENTQYYKNFGNALLNPDGTFTDVGLAWAKAVDALLPQGSKATFFDENGRLRTGWTTTNNDVYNRSGKSFSNLVDYVNAVRNDLILGSRHNVFLNLGNRYFYKDEDGNEHWVDPNEISNYEVSKDPVRSQWNEDNTIYWNDYELTGKTPTVTLKPEPTSTPTPNTDSDIYPETEKKKKGTSKWLSTLGLASYDALPDIVGAGRLFASLRTNNRVAETIRKSLNPVLEDTYERYSPVTGAFSEMLFRNRLAAGVRRTASNPFTSDASLQLAGQLDANRQATDLEYQGFLADDREILRTRLEALARLEDNMARRSAVANKNRLSINTTNKEIAQLEATRLRLNWQSVDNFLLGIEGRMRNRWDINRQRRAQAQENQISWDYLDEIAKIDADWEADNSGKTNQDKLRDPEYVRKVRDARRTRDAALLSIYYAKHGGSLKPSTVYLINKVIKNESNT